MRYFLKLPPAGEPLGKKIKGIKDSSGHLISWKEASFVGVTFWTLTLCLCICKSDPRAWSDGGNMGGLGGCCWFPRSCLCFFFFLSLAAFMFHNLFSKGKKYISVWLTGYPSSSVKWDSFSFILATQIQGGGARNWFISWALLVAHLLPALRGVTGARGLKSCQNLAVCVVCMCNVPWEHAGWMLPSR